MEILFYLVVGVIWTLIKFGLEAQKRNSYESRYPRGESSSTGDRRYDKVENIARKLKGKVRGKGDDLRVKDARYKKRDVEVQVGKLRLNGHPVVFSAKLESAGASLELARTVGQQYRVREVVRLDPGSPDGAHLLRQPRIAHAVSVLFNDPATTAISIRDGWVRVSRYSDMTELSSGQITRGLDKVLSLARAWEHGADAPQIKVAAAATVTASQQCPFCRETLAEGHGLELLACKACGTVQHSECFAEADRRCSSMGCGSTRTETLHGDRALAHQPAVLDLAPCETCGHSHLGCVPGETCRASRRERRQGARLRRQERARTRRRQRTEGSRSYAGPSVPDLPAEAPNAPPTGFDRFERWDRPRRRRRRRRS